MAEYIKDSISGLEPAAAEIYSGNTAVDAILGYYKREALANQIDIQISVSLTDTLPIQDTDFCIILGNLLENALEACIRQLSKKRFMRIVIYAYECHLHHYNQKQLRRKNKTARSDFSFI